jgi:Flp pilus assembly protein TadG
VLVEAVMMLPVLIALICGLIDFGVGMRDRLLLVGASRNAARVAASSANYNSLATADQFALSTLWAGLQRVQNIQIQRVIVFKANPTTWASQSTVPITTVPSACRTLPTNSSGAGLSAAGSTCNVYSATQAQSAASAWVSAYSGGSCSTTTGYDRFWCPTTRTATLAGNSGMGTDYLGVYVEVTYSTFTGFFTRTITMTDTTIVRLEPT